MGFSKPKALAPTASIAPPPVTTTGADVSAAADMERRKQRERAGYQDTLLTQGMGQDSAFMPKKPKKTLLGSY